MDYNNPDSFRLTAKGRLVVVDGDTYVGGRAPDVSMCVWGGSKVKGIVGFPGLCGMVGGRVVIGGQVLAMCIWCPVRLSVCNLTKVCHTCLRSRAERSLKSQLPLLTRSNSLPHNFTCHCRPWGPAWQQQQMLSPSLTSHTHTSVGSSSTHMLALLCCCRSWPQAWQQQQMPAQAPSLSLPVPAPVQAPRAAAAAAAAYLHSAAAQRALRVPIGLLRSRRRLVLAATL